MQSLLRELFVNPGMLWGGVVVAVPILIYLVNRQRYQRRPWAAMEFLLRALQRHRRKLQIQNLLLLLVRIAVLSCLVLALARPIHRRGAVTLAPEGSRNWILAIDLSYSMGYQEDGRSALERARDSIGRLAGTVLKPGDRVAVLAWERSPRVVLPPARFGGDGAEKLWREVSDLGLTSGSLDLGACLAALDELCGKFAAPTGEPESKRILVFSDLQKKDWLDGEGRPRAGVSQFLEKIQNEGGEFAFADLRPLGRPANVAVVELSASPALVAKDVWVELRATVRNFGDEEAGDLDLTIQVDRDPEDASFEPQLGGVVRIPARGTVTRVLPYRFASAGYHTAVAEVRSDGLLIDNRRHLALRVYEDVRVLLVDGDPAMLPLDRETVHLEVALAPERGAEGASGRFTPYRTEYATVDELRELDLDGFALVVLANVADLPADRVEALKSAVRGGGAAMVFLGQNVRADFYNREFGADGFLPGKLGEVRGDLRYPVYLEPADPSHPVVRYFEEHRDATHIHRPIIAFGEYMEVSGLDEGGASGARVLFRFSDAARSPAAFDVGYGAGRVLWFTSTADQEWNEFSSWPDFVVFVHESASYLVRFGQSSLNLLAGETFRRTYPSSEYAPEVVLRTPEPISGDIRRSRNVQKALQPLPGAAEFELVHEDTEAPGLYRIELVRGGGASPDAVEHFAVNVDTSESDLAAMSDEDFRSSFEALRYEVFDASARARRAEGEAGTSRGREFWRWFLVLAFAFAAAETALAYLFGRRPV
ncbi:MAG: BatA domain-containing protein [Planctomycetota bacterium]